MSIWIIIVLLAVLKIPAAALLLWLPFRSDAAADDDDDAGDASDGGDGGIEAEPRPPRGPHPRSPIRWPRRRGPHGGSSSPTRVRLPLLRRRRRVGGSRS